ncbi:GntR family transcriptional regulator [Psychromarinibacter halotolerans]|uniref:GntR family transcriptional regulator n=1 Tax=Psychromarinibacter halotolerans TaxID=1775175 RepID=A0ABV7GYX0_9RHOB|nr:GntR family transcriptional regulator [Psychromarinibacter halotolerans]MAQ84717.1 GntR family transcriptional regulator [Maritimibacter sp.]MDF0596246.1 GntR family transcriptional regulator [Psychromarinibacter halotolerans]
MTGQQRTRVDTVFDAIFQLILSGEIPLGGVVNEASLADRFGVSRGPVREAVKALQGRGLVTKEPYFKARVVDLSVHDMIEIFQLRESVEGMSVKLATRAMSDDSMQRLLDDFEQAGGNGRVLDLHVRIAEESGNSRIQSLLCDELYYLLRLYRARSGSTPGRHDNASAEHWQILRAMKARDAELAESLMRAHIARATEALQRLLDTEPAQPPTKGATGRRRKDTHA